MSEPSAKPRGGRPVSPGSGLGRFRTGLILATLVTLGLGFLWQVLLPGLLPEASPETLDSLRKGGWVGYALGMLLSLFLSLRVTQVRLAGKDPMVPMILGLLGKLVLIALGAILIRGSLAALGDYRAFAVAFVLAVLSFQTVYYPLQERRLRQDRASG